MQTTGAATQEDADVGEEYGTGWQLFDAVYMALYHENPCDPDFQQAQGLVDESGSTDDGMSNSDNCI